jgi:heme A synthase
MLQDRPLELLARGVVFLVVGMLIFGLAVPRLFTVVECGGQFPICDGSLFPKTESSALFIGWFARLFTLALSGLCVLLLAVSVFAYRRALLNLQELTSLAAIMVMLQAAAALLIVVLGFDLVWITAHLLAAILILGVFFLSGIWATYITDERQFRPYFTAFGYLVTIITVFASLAVNFLPV